jgi:protein TonB
VVSGALSLTLVFFLVLPLIQAIGELPQSDTLVRSFDSVALPPPPAPPEPEPEPEPETEEQPPELMEESQPLDLSQLALALDPGFGTGGVGGDFTIDLGAVMQGRGNVDALFSLADLDQKPRALYRPSPVLNAKQRRATPGTVTVVFIVDQAGKVESPVVMNSTDPVFERSALDAVKKWKFEPGKRAGEAVRFRIRQPISFPKS